MRRSTSRHMWCSLSRSVPSALSQMQVYVWIYGWDAYTTGYDSQLPAGNVGRVAMFRVIVIAVRVCSSHSSSLLRRRRVFWPESWRL